MELWYTSYIHLHNFVQYSWMNDGHTVFKMINFLKLDILGLNLGAVIYAL